MFKMNMKKALALLASLLMLCTLIPLSAILATADVNNLVVNGDFENGTNGWAVNAGASIAGGDTHAGSGALRMENPSAWGEAATQVVAVEANSSYTLTWYSKRVSGNGAFDLFIMNNNGYANLDRVGANWMNETSGNWVKNECVVSTGSATQVLLKWSCEVANAGVILVDDLTMVKVGGGEPDAPDADDTVMNMDFEDGVAVFTPGSVVSDGSNCLKWTATGGWSATYRTVTGVQKNTEYTITFKAKGSVAGAMGITIQSGDWGAFYNGPTFDVTTAWKEYTLTTNVENIPTSSGSILFKFQDVGVAMDLYVDDLVMVKKGSEPDVPDIPDVPGTNVVVNGDFENGINGWNLAATALVVGDDTHAGNGALKLENPTAWGEAATQVVTVEPNTEYTITWYTKRVSGNGAFNLFTMNNNGYANLTTVSGQNWMNETSGNWVKNEYVVNTGDATQVLLKWSCEAANAGVIYIDDLSMVKAGEEPVIPPATGNLIVNGDLETGEVAPWDNLWGSNTVSIVEGHNSSNALNVISGTWKHVRQKVTVEPNTDYVLTAWSKGAVEMTLLVKDGADSVNVAQIGFSNGADWTKTSVEFNSAGYTELYVGVMGNTDSSVGTFDDFELVKKEDEPVPPPATGDLIVNGDLETGEVAPWENVWGASTVSIVAGRDSSSALNVISGTWKVVRQKVTVEPNTDYVYSVWSKDAVEMTLLVKDGADTANVAQAGIGSSSDWTKTSVEFNSGSYTEIYVGVMGNTDSSVGTFDDFELTVKGDEPDVPDQPDVPTYPTELINGDFEDGTNGWAVNGSCASNSTDAHKGASALQLDNPSAWSEAALQAVSVQKNTNYVITWYAKRVSGTGAFNLILMNDKNDNYSVDGQNWMNETSGDWTKYKVVLATGENTVIKFKFTNEAANPGVILIDDVSMIIEGSEPVDPTGNLIKNGSFEDGRDEWNWGGDSVLYKDDYYEGSQSAKLSHSAQWGEALAQYVKVEPQTEYVILFYTKRLSGKGVWNLNLMDGDTINTTNKNIPVSKDSKLWFDHETKNEWVEHRIEFNSGDVTKAFVKFSPESADSGTYLVDYVGMWVRGNEPSPDDPDNPIVPPASPMYLTSYGVLHNRPEYEEDNVLENADFESSGGQWKDGFTDDTVSVVKDKTTLSGNKSLFFDTSDKESETKLIFWLDVEPETEYVFSTWLKGAFLSDDNRGLATIGVVKPDGTFLADYVENDIKRFLNGERQIVPTAWDNEWHLRSVEFNSGEEGKVGIAIAGTGSQMWIDDMALYKATAGVQYVSPNAGGNVALDFAIDTYTCQDKDSLIPDPNFDTKDKSGFWADSYGWRNGFLTFEENEYEYGTSLKYTATEENAPLSIIKTIKVKPNTEYTFSLDLKIIEDGWGKLVLMDGKKRNPLNFTEITFDSYAYDADSAYYGWFTTACKFDTDVYDEISIAVVDDGGIVLMDNMRLYESSNGDSSVSDAFVPPPEEESDDWYGDDWPDDEIIEDVPVEDVPVDTPVEPEAPGGDGDSKPVDNSSTFLPLIIGGSALALAGGVVLVIILVKKKKKAAPVDAAAAAAPEAAEAAEPTPEENA